ncbi:MAG: GNAT family N-acetyltransferase [Calditrichaeota bacterium]|nr:MAG: GNAT family N-acetyltransferase [Calditrichota bacterium]MBL1207273.1 GNAT family N-acetyltransferase [Calditrichota bacterium]NOG47106.1 GNAT family N-acetyltransferase [Calditrichota bacterium]
MNQHKRTKTDFKIAEIRPEDSTFIESFIADSWGSTMSVSRGRIFDTVALPGFIYIKNKRVIGLVTYNIEKDNCEIVTLNSLQNNRGLATQLIMKVIEKAKENDCKRVWLITTNDNTYAIRFYQKRGFEWVGFYKDSMNESRNLKPEIPEFGVDRIPIKHEIEFELRF